MAEWAALGFGLRRLVDVKYTGPVEIFGDSQLVINQLKGAWACRAPRLILFRDRCLELLGKLGGWSATWVPRDRNEIADRLSQKAYEEATGKKVVPRRKK